MGFVSVFGAADPEGGARFRERRPPQLCQVIFGLPAERIGYLAGASGQLELRQGLALGMILPRVETAALDR